MRNACILIHIHLQIEKILVFAADSFAIQATSFTRQNALENFMHPCRLWRFVGCGIFLLTLISFGQNYFIDVIDQKVEKFVSILLYVVVKFFFLLP